jgi:hypothetical protein
LEGCLYALHAVLTPEWGDGTLRIAFHVAVQRGAQLEQVTEYVGAPPKAGRIGRRFPSNAGIIGAAYKDNENYVGQRDNDDPAAFVAELIQVWGYSKELAPLLNRSVYSWMAVPFNDPERQEVQGVLYLDSTDREFFTDERQELILQSVSGIARFIGKRYTS